VTPSAQRTRAYPKEYVGREIAKWAPAVKAAGAQDD
jgi:hypothetical protein